ncbi:MAG: hypothetical protein AAFX98_08405, partial [Pseudomonadota bacterium]
MFKDRLPTKALCAVTLAAVTLTSCGGGGGSTPAPTATPAPSPTPTPTPSPSPSPTTCDGVNFLDITDAVTDQTAGTGFPASNAIDDNLSASSSWSATTFPASITLDLADQHLIKEVGIAWQNGDTRTSTFTLET